jgi:hypothetical protein
MEDPSFADRILLVGAEHVDDVDHGYGVGEAKVPVDLTRSSSGAAKLGKLAHRDSVRSACI